MTVVPFRPRSLPTGWRSVELEKLVSACNIALSNGDASGWAIGMTEPGDPQLYLLGPAPDYDCILCVSRLKHRYVLEDGQGRIIFEHDSLGLLGERAWAALRRKKSAFTARIALTWCAVRETFEERVEPLLDGPVELLTHVAPQLAALA